MILATANLIMVTVLAIAWALSPQVVGLLVPGSLLAVLIGTVVIGLSTSADGQPGRAAGLLDPQPPPNSARPSASACSTRRLLLCAAWLSDIAGRGGLYLLAFASGLTDVDAIALSALRLYNLNKLEGLPTAVSILLAMLANLGFKTFLAFLLGGAGLGRRVIVWACSPWERGSPEESSGCSIQPYNENILLHPWEKEIMAQASQRIPAVAGLFYPADPHSLHAQVAGFLAAAMPGEMVAAPKAVVVPHAGYIYSGAVAASAYAELTQRRDTIGIDPPCPTHRVYVRGMAVLRAAQSFLTPLGAVAVDREGPGSPPAACPA